MDAIHLLDMGRLIYGDCILAKIGGKTILIDGGHPADYEGQKGFDSIPEQLKRILGAEPPFRISLLVVTHCHNDHIGCLPELVRDGIVQPEWALVTDEHLGFGRARNAVSPLDALTTDERSLVVALQEEDHSDLDDVELARFLVDAANVESRYKAMLATLERRGTRIVRHGTEDSAKELQEAFVSAGLEILGPAQEQLLICSEMISRTTTHAIDAVADAARMDSNPVSIYRQLMSSPTGIDLLDRPGKGAAINDQSIVLKLGTGDNKALLAGDMQLVAPEVAGLREHMDLLRKKIKAAGPYRFVKASHHTSYNGLDETILEECGSPRFVGHSGGSNDPAHPDRKTLGILKAMGRHLTYARTDRNGVVTISADGFEKERGRLNDFTPNAGRDLEAVPPPFTRGGTSIPQTGLAPGSVQTSGLQSQSGSFAELIYMRLPYRSGSLSIGDIPISFDFNDRPSPAAPPSNVDPTALRLLGGGRPLPKLLFATSSPALGHKLGADAAAQIAGTVQDAGMAFCDETDSATLLAAVTRRLKAEGDFRGVVLLGGYDIVPSQRVDVLDSQLRRAIGADAFEDPDDFLVWSDDAYGDHDDDGLAEVPVSRIPDGGSLSLLMTCLTGSIPRRVGRFGIRNSLRPFAKAIWKLLPGDADMHVSGPHHHKQLSFLSDDASHMYFMLHGDFQDSSRFWGEEQGPVEAINVGNLPIGGIDMVFAGCCWGALTVSSLAKSAAPVQAKTPADSMALASLAAGARAFIGCTGAHYSPDAGAEFFGGPMHKHFWSAVNRRMPPAEALFVARREFLAEMPHGMTQPLHIGIERKIYKQFTCLGLGW